MINLEWKSYEMEISIINKTMMVRSRSLSYSSVEYNYSFDSDKKLNKLMEQENDSK